MSVKTVEFLVGDRQLRLTGDHISYLDGIEAAQQSWGDTPLMRPLMRLIKSLPSGATYLDVGANIGLTAIGAATARPDLHVVAFEPVSSNADFLTQNVRANSANNCTVVRSALSNEGFDRDVPGRGVSAASRDITEALWGTRVSPSTVSDLNKKIYGTIETCRNRPIEGEHPYAKTEPRKSIA